MLYTCEKMVGSDFRGDKDSSVYSLRWWCRNYKKNPGLRILKQPSKSLLNLLYYYVPISKEERKVVFDITIILEWMLLVWCESEVDTEVIKWNLIFQKANIIIGLKGRTLPLILNDEPLSVLPFLESLLTISLHGMTIIINSACLKIWNSFPWFLYWNFCN